MEIEDRFTILIALFFAIMGFMFLSGRFDVSSFRFTDTIAEKEDLTKIIKDAPCAFDPINKAVAAGPIDIRTAKDIADTCVREDKYNAERKKQQDALKQISTSNN